MYSSEPKERLILWNTEPTSNPPSDHYFVWINDGKFYTLDDQGVQKEYATIEELSAKVNTSDIVDNLTSEDVDKPLSANQGKVLQDSKEDADSTILKESDVEDNLKSTSTTKPLSANQGKLLEDNKASLSGADFTVMPQVSGNPVVESGSNSDGSWVRWADGTQISSIQGFTLEYHNSQVLRNDWTYPQAFSERPIILVSGGENSESRPNSSEGWFSLNEGSSGALYSATRARLFLGGSSGTFSSGNTVNINAIAKGRW